MSTKKLEDEPLLESLGLSIRLTEKSLHLVLRLAHGYWDRMGSNTVMFRHVIFDGLNNVTSSLEPALLESRIHGWTVTRDSVRANAADLCFSSCGCIQFEFESVAVEDKLGIATEVGDGWVYHDENGNDFDFYAPFD